MATDDVKKRILAKVDLESLIGDHIKLQTMSGRRVGLCPFHEEKTPSFNIYGDHYHCYGCKAHGDAIDFVRHVQGLGFIDALKFLAKRFGVDASELERSQGRWQKSRDTASLYRMMGSAQAFYQQQLTTPRGEPVRQYLEQRGFDADSIKAFGFGLTPQEGYGLSRYLRKQNYSDKDMIDCSLATKSTRDNSTFDFLRSRLTIPIFDPQGRVIGFGGRALDDHPAKYMNSRDTVLFNKSNTLYGLETARKPMRAKGRAVLCEGYMDVLQMRRYGFDESVACLGTAMTEQHLRKLKEATNRLILVFDGDQAGQKATLSAVQIALAVPQVRVQVVRLPKGEDPDSFLREQGAAALEELLGKATDLLDFAIGEKVRNTHDLAIPSMVTKEFMPWLARVNDRMQRDFLLNRVAQLTGLPEGPLQRELLTLMRAGTGARAGGPPSHPGHQAPAQQAPGQGAPHPAANNGELRGAQQAEPEAPAAPETMPEGRAYELIGQLFHSEPDDFTAEARERFAKFVRQELEFGPAMLKFVDDLLASLAAGEPPNKRPATAWEASALPELMGLIQQLLRQSDAFVVRDRGLAMGQLMRLIRRKRLETTVKSLRSQLNRQIARGADQTEITQILRLIKDFNDEITILDRAGRPPEAQQ